MDSALPPLTATDLPLNLRRLGLQPYVPIWQQMQAFNAARTADTPDEFWLLEHEPVYTLGREGGAEHLLEAGDIPLVRVDRGGQITYHGPGQLVLYLLLDLRRRRLGVRQLVAQVEAAIIDLLAGYGIHSHLLPGAPGVFVASAKIASLGLRVSQGCSSHGLALNIAMDLAPFRRINPCGYQGLAVTQLRDLGVVASPNAAGDLLARGLAQRLGYHQRVEIA